jgi:hypothetical protein
MTRTLIIILASLVMVGCFKDEVKYYKCTHQDRSGGLSLYAYDKKYFYTVEYDSFKEINRFKIEKSKDEIIYAPVFYKDNKNNSEFKHMEYRFDKSKENLNIHYYSEEKSNNPSIRNDYYLKCQEVRPAK